jgi:hypothetical protein
MAEIMTTPTEAITTASIRALLRKRYAPNEWAFLEEVAPKTGGSTSYADGVAINLWRSRGLGIYGFEIKVSRSDWLREMKKPAKAEGVFTYCDGWYVVAPPGVVQTGELPAAWGYLEAQSASKLVQRVSAPRLTPTVVDRQFFASLMRRAYENLDQLTEQKIQEAMRDAHGQIEARVRDGITRGTARENLELTELRKRITEWEVTTRLKFERYNGPSRRVIQIAQEIENMSSYVQRRERAQSTASFEFLGRIADQLQNAADTLHRVMLDVRTNTSGTCELAVKTKDAVNYGG